MQIKVNNKLILICLLLCFLFLTCYKSVLDTNGIVSSNINVSISTVSEASEHTSMTADVNIGHDHYMAATNTLVGFSTSSLRHSRWLGTKTSFNILTAIISAQMACLIFYSRLSDRTYTQLFSSKITIFLHKKDGMK